MRNCEVKVIEPIGLSMQRLKTFRYRNPVVDTTAAMNPIVMASHGSRTADTETPTATPPASMHDCKWIWYRGSGALCFGSGLCYTRQKSVSGLFISMTEGTDHNSDHTGLNFPLGLQSTDAAAAVTALAARARYVLYTAAAFLLSFTRAELKLGQNIQRNTVPGEQRISQVIFCIADLQLAHFPTVLSATKSLPTTYPTWRKDLFCFHISPFQILMCSD